MMTWKSDRWARESATSNTLAACTYVCQRCSSGPAQRRAATHGLVSSNAPQLVLQQAVLGMIDCSLGICSSGSRLQRLRAGLQLGCQPGHDLDDALQVAGSRPASQRPVKPSGILLARSCCLGSSRAAPDAKVEHANGRVPQRQQGRVGPQQPLLAARLGPLSGRRSVKALLDRPQIQPVSCPAQCTARERITYACPPGAGKRVVSSSVAAQLT